MEMDFDFEDFRADARGRPGGGRPGGGGNSGGGTTTSGSTLNGTNSNDRITGTSGADTIDAANGDDTITGAGGADKIYGGNGRDYFIYTSTSDSTTSSYDTIYDFTTSDIMDLSAIDANTSVSGDQAFVFNQSVDVVSSGSNYMVRVDVNDDGGWDMYIQITGATSYTSSNIVL